MVGATATAGVMEMAGAMVTASIMVMVTAEE